MIVLHIWRIPENDTDISSGSATQSLQLLLGEMQYTQGKITVVVLGMSGEGVLER